MKKTTDNTVPIMLAASFFFGMAGCGKAQPQPPPSPPTAGAPAVRVAPPAGSVVRYQAQAGDTTVTIQGTSTLHEWEMKGTLIAGFVEFPAGINFDLKQTSLPGLKDGVLPANVTARITVSSIHSDVTVMASVMDGLMQDAMKEKEFPRILYHVTELKLKAPHVAGQPFEFDARGDLAIAGVTNKVEFPVTIQPADNNKIKISGAAKLKMTDYKIEPPHPSIVGIGPLKCGDEVKVLFEWTLQLPPTPPSALRPVPGR